MSIAILGTLKKSLTKGFVWYINENDFQHHIHLKGDVTMFRWLSFFLILLSFISLNTSIAGERLKGGSWLEVVGEIKGEMERVMVLYKEGGIEEAKSHITDAYFGIFEEKRMEEVIRINISAKRAYELERLFGDIRKGVVKNLPLKEVSRMIEELIAQLKDTAKELDRLKISYPYKTP